MSNHRCRLHLSSFHSPRLRVLRSPLRGSVSAVPGAWDLCSSTCGLCRADFYFQIGQQPQGLLGTDYVSDSGSPAGPVHMPIAWQALKLCCFSKHARSDPICVSREKCNRHRKGPEKVIFRGFSKDVLDSGWAYVRFYFFIYL